MYSECDGRQEENRREMRKVNGFLHSLPLFSTDRQLCSHNSSELISSFNVSETMHFENTIILRLKRKKTPQIVVSSLMKRVFPGNKMITVHHVENTSMIPSYLH